MSQCPKIQLKPRVLGFTFYLVILFTGVLDLEKMVSEDRKSKKKKPLELSDTSIKSFLMTSVYLVIWVTDLGQVSRELILRSFFNFCSF